MKKGVPIREDEESLVEQVPDDLMGEMIRGLVALAEKRLAEKQKDEEEQSDGSVKWGMLLHSCAVLFTSFSDDVCGLKYNEISTARP